MWKSAKACMHVHICCRGPDLGVTGAPLEVCVGPGLEILECQLGLNLSGNREVLNVLE